MVFRSHVEGYTLPGFWGVCERCEPLVAAGDDAGLLATRLRSDVDGSAMEPSENPVEVEHVKASIAAFRAADLGPRPLP